MNEIKFESLNVPRDELRISKCLPAGQSFSWRKVSADSFVGVLGHRVFQLNELENDTLFRCLYDGCRCGEVKKERLDDSDTENVPLKKNRVALEGEKVPTAKEAQASALTSDGMSTFYCCRSTPYEHIRHYLNLDFDWEKESKAAELDSPIGSLSEAYANWSEADPCISSSPKGIRLLNIDPIEALFVGVATANNNISRITSIANNMRRRLGTFLCSIDDLEIAPCERAESEQDRDYSYYSFPTSLQILSNSSEEVLREQCGAGYRAKSIISISRELNARFESDGMFADFVKSLEYTKASLYLQEFHGVGQKVADFVLLSGFGFSTAVPVDTHILKYISKHVKYLSNASSLSKSRYLAGAQFIRDRFRFLPGWAQLVLFSSSVLK